MTTPNDTKLVSSELGNLWLAYQEKTMLMKFLEHFLEHTENEETQRMLQRSYDLSVQSVIQIRSFFELAGAVIPVGFTEGDLHKGAPKLFDYTYDVMFLHLMSKIETALFSLHSTMSYRLDVFEFFRQLSEDAQETYRQTTQYLLQIGVLSRPPYVSMPKEVEMVTNKSYFSGYSLLNEKRALNTVEVSLIHNAIETNLTGMQLMMGFAQVAHDKQVKKYFADGMDLSKKIETTLGEFLREEFIEPPATHAGKATNSTIAPFSDKLMMYITSILSTFGLGSNAIGGAFSLRNDLPITMAILAKDIVSFAKEGGKIMVENGWMEEPPQVEDRKQLKK